MVDKVNARKEAVRWHAARLQPVVKNRGTRKVEKPKRQYR